MSMRTPTWRCNRKLMAAGIKLASYQVSDPLTEAWTEEQFHLTYNNTLIASLTRSEVELLQNFMDEYGIVNLPCEEVVETGTNKQIRFVMFEEQQDDNEPWTIIHVYESGVIKARMGKGDAKLLVGFLEEFKPPKQETEEE